MGLLVVVGLTLAHAPSGAIFTTLPDGSSVNANIYPSKSDVYLDGGPGPNAPQDAAGLDDGIYVFQVTDPSGKVLLSQDEAQCRIVEVSEGVITAVLDWDGTGITTDDFTGHDYDGGPLGKPAGSDRCHKEGQNHDKHDSNPDLDHGPPAIVVQLMPYADTPNPGGVYKAWMVRIEDFLLGCQELGFDGESGLEEVDCGYAAGNFHGFIPAHTKTDNFKVREDRPGKPREEGDIVVMKYCDTDCDGVMDVEDAFKDGVQIDVTDSLGITVCSGVTVGGYFDCLDLPEGLYTVTETLGSDAAVCGASVDGVPIGATTSVVVEVFADTAVVVSFGNTATDGEIIAKKKCGVGSEGPIAGVQMNLTGLDILNNVIDESGLTDAQGEVVFSGLAAGSYTVTEVPPANLVPLGPTTCEVDLVVDASLDPTTGVPQCTAGSATCTFENVAVGNVGARTPGFWCVQVLRDAGINSGDSAACFERLECAFPDGVQDVIDGALALAVGIEDLYDLDGSGDVTNAEAQVILCPQIGDAEHEQCRRQSFALLMNLAGHLDEDDNPECGSGCSIIGVTTGQVIIVDGQFTTVGAIVDRLLNDGCTAELHDIIQGINENTITVLDDCPSSV